MARKLAEKFDKNRGQIRGLILTALPGQAIILTGVSELLVQPLHLLDDHVTMLLAQALQQIRDLVGVLWINGQGVILLAVVFDQEIRDSLRKFPRLGRLLHLATRLHMWLVASACATEHGCEVLPRAPDPQGAVRVAEK